jgi:hypothetical protein
MVRSVDVRDSLVKTLQLDLVGPGPGHPHEAEQLWESEPPSRWYLTGFLVPTKAPEHLRFDPESAEVLDAPATGHDGAGDDDVEPDAAPARRVFLPSSIGVSVLVPAGTTTLHAEAARPDLRGRDTRDWDDRVAELQFRDAVEYAVGHGVATHAALDPDGRCRTVETTWIPGAEVEKVVPAWSRTSPSRWRPWPRARRRRR